MSLKFYRYELPLTRRVHLSRDRELDSRIGFLVRRKSAWAEASPLPGFSKEGEAEVLEDFQRLLDETEPQTASVRFAWHCLENLPDEGVDITIAALLSGEPNDMLVRAAELVKQKCPAVKLKVGTRTVKEDAEIAREVYKRLEGKCRFRLDANRQWTAKQALAFADLTEDLSFDYVEEPVNSDFALADVRLKAKWRTAYDETLQAKEGVVTILETATSDMLVDKPTLTGGLRFEDVVGKIRVTHSAAYESGVGLYRIAQMASAAKLKYPAGLDTYALLADDVLKRRLNFKGWKLKLKRMPPVDLSKLEEIEL